MDENRIEDGFEKKVVTYPFSVNGMSLQAFKEFKADAIENFNDSYASKIVFDHKFRTDQKQVNMLNDKVDLIYENIIMHINIMQQKITELSNILLQMTQEEKKKDSSFEDELFTRR